MLKKALIIVLALAIIAVGVVYYIASQDKPGEQASAQNETITVTDLVGNSVTLKKDIQRIVLLRSKDIYSLAVLFGDELPKKLIAWGPDLRTDDKTAYDKLIEKYPELKNIPETGSVYTDDLSVEQILSLKPDLIILDKFMMDRGYKYVAKLKEVDLPVVYLDGSTDPYTGSQNGIRLLGKILNKEDKAKEVVDYIDGKINDTLERIEKNTNPPPTVYIEAGNKGVGIFSQTYGSTGTPKQYTSWGTVLNKLKVNNIADGIVGVQEPINPEFVLKANPEVIIITGQNWTTPADTMKLGYFVSTEEASNLLKAFTTRPGWSELSAVKNKRVYSVFHNTVSCTTFSAIQALAKDCYPEQFNDVDPEAGLKEFHQKFMPISYSGCWMVGID